MFLTPTGLVGQEEFVKFLNRCADDWEKVATGSFYGITRKKVDQEALAQAARVRAKAVEIANQLHN